METLRNPQRKPTHAGEILREDILPSLGITQTEFAKRLGVSRLTVSELLHEKRGVSPDMALRLGKLLGNGEGLWLRLQQACDIWALKQSHAAEYDRIEQIAA